MAYLFSQSPFPLILLEFPSLFSFFRLYSIFLIFLVFILQLYVKPFQVYSSVLSLRHTTSLFNKFLFFLKPFSLYFLYSLRFPLSWLLKRPSSFIEKNRPKHDILFISLRILQPRSFLLYIVFLVPPTPPPNPLYTCILYTYSHTGKGGGEMNQREG